MITHPEPEVEGDEWFYHFRCVFCGTNATYHDAGSREYGADQHIAETGHLVRIWET